MNTDWGIDSSWSLFLDRDGVINKRNFKGYVLNYNDFVFQDGALKAIAQFKNKFKYIFIVTNQQCVGKKLLSLEKLNSIPFVTVAHITTGRFNIYCKIRSKNTNHAKEIIFMIDDIDGVSRTETMISLEESINDKKRLMHKIFNEIA